MNISLTESVGEYQCQAVSNSESVSRRLCGLHGAKWEHLDSMVKSGDFGAEVVAEMTAVSDLLKEENRLKWWISIYRQLGKFAEARKSRCSSSGRPVEIESNSQAS